MLLSRVLGPVKCIDCRPESEFDKDFRAVVSSGVLFLRKWTEHD